MDALTALHTRNSINLLTEPAPSKQQLDNIIKAGLRACDHRSLKPWKFLLIEGEARAKFGDLMVKAKEAADGCKLAPDFAISLKNKPFRAPTILVVVAAIKQHDKVPEVEQILSAGAAAQMMMTAAHAQDIGAIWRSGSMMFTDQMHRGLGLDTNDKIVGFIYLGKAKIAKPLAELDPSDFLSTWEG